MIVMREGEREVGGRGGAHLAFVEPDEGVWGAGVVQHQAG